MIVPIAATLSCLFIKTVSTTIPHPHIAIQSLGQNPNSPDHTPTADGGPGAVLAGPTIATFADGNTLNAHGCDRIRTGLQRRRDWPMAAAWHQRADVLSMEGATRPLALCRSRGNASLIVQSRSACKHGARSSCIASPVAGRLHRLAGPISFLQHVTATNQSLALERPRFGYRRLCALLAHRGQKANHKCVYRVSC